MSGASERANGQASGPVLTSLFLFIPDHSALVRYGEEKRGGFVGYPEIERRALVAEGAQNGRGCCNTNLS